MSETMYRVKYEDDTATEWTYSKSSAELYLLLNPGSFWKVTGKIETKRVPLNTTTPTRKEMRG